jgi:hypothetical protein
MNRQTLPRLALAAAAVCLVLSSCASHDPEKPRTSPPPPAAPVTGSLSDVDCDGLSPDALGAPVDGMPSEARADDLEAWLLEAAEARDDDGRLRTYLHCLAERGAEHSSGSERSP